LGEIEEIKQNGEKLKLSNNQLREDLNDAKETIANLSSKMEKREVTQEQNQHHHQQQQHHLQDERGFDSSTFHAMATKLSSVTRELEALKEGYSNLMSEYSSLKAHVSNDRAAITAGNLELKSVISAEITGRRKGFTKLSSAIEQVTIKQNDMYSLVRKDLQHLSENLNLKIDTNERHVTKICETNLRESRESKEYARQMIQRLGEELRARPAQPAKDLQPSLIGYLTEEEFTNRIQILKNKIDAEHNARLLIEQSIGAMFEEERSYTDKKIEDMELLIDRNIQHLVRDVSEEISKEISDAENRAMDGVASISESLGNELALVANAAAESVVSENRERKATTKKVIRIIEGIGKAVGLEVDKGILDSIFEDLTDIKGKESLKSGPPQIAPVDIEDSEDTHGAAATLQKQWRKSRKASAADVTTVEISTSPSSPKGPPQIAPVDIEDSEETHGARK
jgi:chromosome segregation ATPase